MNVRTLAHSLSLLALVAAPAVAQHDGHKGPGAGHSPAGATAHGGAGTMTKAHHFEVVFERDSVRVYLYDMDQKPISAEGVTGRVAVRFQGKGRKGVKAKFKVSTPKGGDGSSHLVAKVKLKGVAEGEAKAAFEFAKLPEEGEATASFTVTFKLARLTEFVCPMKCEPAKAEAGRCGKCGMALKESKFIYACPMHPQITARKQGADCWACGMKLTKADGSQGAEKQGHGGHGGH